MPAGNARAKTVLLVEDDLSIRDILQDELEEDGYDVVPATNGKQAIEYLTLDSSPHPDLIILDLMTPIVTGWQVLERLRGDPELSRIPVIVVTAASGDKPSGVTAVLRKPFRMDALFATVRSSLGQTRP
jgi:two-component system, OmpR family, response regulator CpxR